MVEEGRAFARCYPARFGIVQRKAAAVGDVLRWKRSADLRSPVVDTHDSEVTMVPEVITRIPSHEAGGSWDAKAASTNSEWPSRDTQVAQRSARTQLGGFAPTLDVQYCLGRRDDRGDGALGR